MSRTRGTSDNLHPRLTVAPVTAAERAAVVDTFTCAVHVDRTSMRRTLRDVTERRRAEDEVRIEALDRDMAVLSGRRDAASSALDDLRREQQHLLDAADWCLRQPDEDSADAARQRELGAEIDDHSQGARSATRELERVLEQQAAATAALEEARRELTGLGSTGIGEPEVRRDMEAAWGELRAAAATHQEAEAAADRLRYEAARLQSAGGDGPVALPPDGDRFKAMRRALDARYARSDAGLPGPLEEALESVRAADARAGATAAALADARRRVDGFELELSARSSDDGACEARHRAAAELEERVASLEQRLGEAETAARARMDTANRAVSRAELARDRVRQDVRQRRRRLQGLLSLTPSSDRPAPADDILACVRDIADGLRDLAGQMTADIDAAEVGLGRLEAQCDERFVELEACRAGLDGVVARDRVDALTALVADAGAPVVLDDVVATEDTPDAVLTVADLLAVESTNPLVVLAPDPAVVAWAIDLPAGRAAVVSAAALLRPRRTDADDVTDLTVTTATPTEPAPSHAR